MEVEKIAIVEHVGGHGGMDYYDYGLAFGLAANGVEVSYHTCNQTQTRKFDNVHTYHTFGNLWGKLKVFRIFSFYKNYLKAFYLANVSGIQLVHLHIFDFTTRNFLLVIFSKLFSFKLVITVHDVISFFDRSNKLSEKYILKWADGIIVHNQAAYNDLMNRHIKKDVFEHSYLAIIPHGNYLPFINEIKNTPGDSQSLKILFFGQIKKVKGLEILLEALNIVLGSGRKIHLTIAGKPSKIDFERYNQMINDLSLRDNVTTILRYINDEEIDTLYQNNDLVILPYRVISQSGILLLSMSYGLPVLTSDLPAFTDVIKDGFNGFLFESGKPNSLANKLVEIYDNRDLLREVAINSNQVIRDEYDWGLIGKETVAYYQKVMNSK